MQVDKSQEKYALSIYERGLEDSVSDLDVFTYKIAYNSFTELCSCVSLLFPAARIHPTTPLSFS
jgi:hypothetical protein